MKDIKLSRRTMAIFNCFEERLIEMFNKLVTGRYNAATYPVTAMAIMWDIEDKLKELKLIRDNKKR